METVSDRKAAIGGGLGESAGSPPGGIDSEREDKSMRGGCRFNPGTNLGTRPRGSAGDGGDRGESRQTNKARGSED